MEDIILEKLIGQYVKVISQSSIDGIIIRKGIVENFTSNQHIELKNEDGSYSIAHLAGPTQGVGEVRLPIGDILYQNLVAVSHYAPGISESYDKEEILKAGIFYL